MTEKKGCTKGPLSHVIIQIWIDFQETYLLQGIVRIQNLEQNNKYFFCEMRLLKAKNNIVFDSDLVWQMQLMIIIG